MREIINSTYVAEVHDGKVVYFKEYSTMSTDTIPSRIIAREKVLKINYDPTIPDYIAEQAFETDQLAKHISDMLNRSSIVKKLFFDKMDRQHRYLQGEFTQFCLEWFRHCASDKYQTDGRNEWCHDLGVKIDKVT